MTNNKSSQRIANHVGDLDRDCRLDSHNTLSFYKLQSAIGTSVTKWAETGQFYKPKARWVIWRAGSSSPNHSTLCLKSHLAFNSMLNVMLNSVTFGEKHDVAECIQRLAERLLVCPSSPPLYSLRTTLDESPK
ncbi:hypothetical protein H5410_001553 [Solanum commersonii]|uniref:Uncharacterized protein n=1 Tax=Solanum commersonii TaxID=4109 RepID=A0A9J6AZH7_SOLCO|nr:hypothetical protein H5410_001553 [Solanum commersonii]